MTKNGTYFLSFLCVGTLIAPISGLAVTLLEAYQNALIKNEMMAIRRTEVVQSEERLTQGWAAVMPQVNFMANYLRQDKGSSQTSAFTREDQGTARFNLTQPLFHGLGDWWELKSRKAQIRAQEQTERQARLDLMAGVADAYFNVLQAEADSKVLDEQLQLMEKRIDELKGRVKIGRSRRGELLSAEAQRASVVAQREATALAITSARRAFANMTRLAPDAALTDLGEGLRADANDVNETNVNDVIEKRPDVAAARERVTSSEESISVMSSQHFPQLDLGANYYLKRTGILENTKWDLGLTLTVPLYRGGGILAQTREASEKNKATTLALSQLREEVRRQITTWHATYTQNVAQLNAFDEAVKLSEANYTEQVKDFRNGLVNNLEVLTAMNALQDTRRNRNKLRYQTEIARYRYLAAIGREEI